MNLNTLNDLFLLGDEVGAVLNLDRQLVNVHVSVSDLLLIEVTLLEELLLIDLVYALQVLILLLQGFILLLELLQVEFEFLVLHL